MLFNSYEFLFLFLPVTLATFFILGSVSYRLATAWLALASVFFYGFWNPKFVTLLLASVVVNFAFGVLISRRRAAGNAFPILTLAVCVDLVLQFYFKYANFFVDNINVVSGAHIELQAIVLPLGISFFTFTQIAFLIDTYCGKDTYLEEFARRNGVQVVPLHALFVKLKDEHRDSFFGNDTHLSDEGMLALGARISSTSAGADGAAARGRRAP